jgi:ribulose-phosphate 3-epimerase
MGSIIPAILPVSREDLDQKLLALNSLTDEVQLDVIDGRFAGPPTWPYTEGGTSMPELPELGSFKFEVDLMVEDPEACMGDWVEAGATRVTVHAETAHNLAHVIDSFQRTYGHDKSFAPDLLAFGLSVNVQTDTALIEPFLEKCNYVQFMGIARIGRQAEPFDTTVIAKIRAFHRKYPDMQIQVDGGVSRQTIPDLLRAGASRFVVGSALWRSGDVRKEYEALGELTQTQGLYS